jgi:hypothetical protein
MTWATTMTGLTADDGGVDGGQWKKDDGVLCGLREYLQPELLVRKSRHCLIHLTTFITVSIVHIVGIVRVHIRDSKPCGKTYHHGKTCLSPSLIVEHFPGTVTDFTACSLSPPLAFTFDLLPKTDDVVLFYFIYLHVSKSLFIYLPLLQTTVFSPTYCTFDLNLLSDLWISKFLLCSH